VNDGPGNGESFDPAGTYLYLKGDGTGEPLAVTETFWSDLMEGRINIDDGYMMMAGDVRADMGHWEIHPEGEEVLLRLAGAFRVVMENRDGPPPRLDAETPAIVIPRNTWHRLTVDEPGRVVFITYGRGTEHRGL